MINRYTEYEKRLIARERELKQECSMKVYPIIKLMAEIKLLHETPRFLVKPDGDFIPDYKITDDGARMIGELEETLSYIQGNFEQAIKKLWQPLRPIA